MSAPDLIAIAALRARAWANGWRPMAVLPWDFPDPEQAGKKPLGKEWQKRARQDPPECTTLPAVAHAPNTGILCDGLRAIDIDVDDPDTADAIQGLAFKMLGATICRGRDNSSKRQIPYRAAQGCPQKRTITGKAHTKQSGWKIEVLGIGQQFVAFGTHPSGAELKWYPACPASRKLSEIPEITEEQVTAFLAACAPLIGADSPAAEPKPNGKAASHGDAGDNGTADIQDVVAALAVIPNDGPADWDHWNSVGMAVWRASGGSNEGYDAWLEWSAKHPAHDEEACAKRWQHYPSSPPDRTGAGKLFKMAAKARKSKGNGNGHDKAAEADLPGGGTIVVQNGLRHEAADAGLLAMRQACIQFYQRDRSLVRVCAVNAKASDGTVVTSPGIVNITLPMLSRALGKSTRWARLDKDGNQRRVDPPKEVVEQIGGMLGEWPFDCLTGVIGTQTLRPDGSRLFTEGYDHATGLYLLAPPPMPQIPEKPTMQDALEALALLNDLLVDFPFADNASRSVAISMLMTPVLRGALPPAVPIHAVTAPEAGTGKSYLMDTASAIANGERCAVQSVAPKEDETEKRLIGAALAGLPIIALDNCNGILSGDFLAQVSERPSMRVRPLGGSGLVRLSNTFTTFLNGNNLTIAADLTRRTIRCCLDAETDDTTGRTYSGDPVATVLADRGRYVAAVLTIALAYLAAGEPNPPRPLPSFERWSRIVCGSLTWLGWENPMDTMSDVRADDPSRQQLAAVLEAWPRDLTSYTTGELVDAATECHSDGSGPMNPAWLDAVKEVGRDRRGNIDAIQLGNWLRDHRDRMSGSRKLVRDGTPTRPRWKVAV